MSEELRTGTEEAVTETIEREDSASIQRGWIGTLSPLLARFGFITMYLAGLVIMGLAINEAFFVDSAGETLAESITQSLVVAVGGLVLVITTWLWKKVV